MTVLAFAGCGPSNHLASELTALEQAGLKPAGFVEADAAKMGAKACQTGTVNQLPAMLCEYDDAQAAAGAKGTVESWVGAALTGVVVNREQYVLALADHAQLDPNGKEISAVARAFRKQAAPGSAGAGAAGMTEAGVSTAAAAGASQSTAGEGQPAAPGQPASP